MRDRVRPLVWTGARGTWGRFSTCHLKGRLKTCPTRACLGPAFVLTLAVVLAAGCLRGPAPAVITTAGGGKTKETSAEPAFTLTSEQLAREYHTDRAAAEGKYKDRWLIVEGTLEDFDLFSSGGVLARVGKSAGGPGIRCEFVPKATARLTDLTKGQKLKCKGRCVGGGGDFVDLVECELLEVGPDPAIAVSAVRLTRDYAGDDKAADGRYREKVLVVEGTVFGRKDAEQSVEVVLEGFDEKALFPVRVVANAAGRKEEFAGLKKGDKVKIKGECGGSFLGEVRVRGARLVR